LPPYLHEIAETFTTLAVEKITIQKSARIGYSMLLSSLIAYPMTENPAAVLRVLIPVMSNK
jgi:phage terminase large subunit GpA-like protein